MARAGGGHGTALYHGREPPAPRSRAARAGLLPALWPLWAQPQLSAGAAPCLQEPQGTGEERSSLQELWTHSSTQVGTNPRAASSPSLGPSPVLPGQQPSPAGAPGAPQRFGLPSATGHRSQHSRWPGSAPSPPQLNITGGQGRKGGEGSPGAPRAEELKLCPKTLCFSPPTQPPPAATRSASPLARKARRSGPLCVGLAF